MKKIYFVRHGESEGNVKLIMQGPETLLTERGREQAVAIAERCAKLPIEAIVSSSMVRAKQTAEIIAEKTNKPLEFSDLFVERRRPKEVSGKHFEDPEVVGFRRAIRDTADIDFRFSDEENFGDLKERAYNALEFLRNRKEENILVVTHGLFLRMIVAYVFFGEQLNGHEIKQLFWKLSHANTGITVIEFNDKENSWNLRTWNDHAHLG